MIGLGDLIYVKLLSGLNFVIIERRRLRGQLIIVYQIQKMVDLDQIQFFNLKVLKALNLISTRSQQDSSSGITTSR